MADYDRQMPVLIVGGGPVGLALAADLGWRGIECLLIEQTDGAITTPKMNEVNIRSMEFCRRWGIEDKVTNCPFPADYAKDVVFMTSMSGYELGRMKRPSKKDVPPNPFSPVNMTVCSQKWFDPMLADLARSFPPVELRHRWRMESFSADSGGGDCGTSRSAKRCPADGAGALPGGMRWGEFAYTPDSRHWAQRR